MHIALCHDALIPPETYGGTERVIYWLAKALCELGHRVTLIARDGSHVPGVRVLPFLSTDSIDDLLPEDVDIAHLWATPCVTPQKSFLVTIEGNGQPGERFHPNTIFISKQHAENHGSVDFVYNGADPDDFDCSYERDDYFVFLAKASWKVKNLEGAIATARACGKRLKVLGSRNWPFKLQRRLPTFGGVQYLGMVDDAEKRQVLSRARGLLFPVRWHEPFGVAVIEALFSGCPVFGTPYGSLPEMISNEVGVLSPNGSELICGMKSFDSFDPQAIRSYAVKRFGHLDMARRYLAYYRNVISTGYISSSKTSALPPRAQTHIEMLLPWQPPEPKLRSFA